MKYIKNIKKQKLNTLQIILYSVILGIIINVISDALGFLLDIKPKLYLTLGIAIIIFLLSFTLVYNILKLNLKVKFVGDLIINKDKNNDILPIPNYEISKDMKDYLKSSFIENKAIKNLWCKGNFDYWVVAKEGNVEKIKRNENETKKLLVELIEYCVLENLSSFIVDYFNKLNMKKKVISINQNSIPEILLNNRFLKLFSENPNNRNAFVGNEAKEFNNVILMTIGNGAMYRKFDLSLPKGSKVYRKNDKIMIDTKLFKLSLKINFDGFNSFIEPDFYKYYIHSKSDAFQEYEFQIEVEVKYKVLSIFKIMDWKYYNWLDEYIDVLQNYCDIKTFYKNINWCQSKTLIQILNAIDNKKK